MELPDYLLSRSAVLSAVFVTLFIPILYFFLSEPSYEEPVDYDVPVPEQCHREWDGKILDEPSIKALPPTC